MTIGYITGEGCYLIFLYRLYQDLVTNIGFIEINNVMQMIIVLKKITYGNNAHLVFLCICIYRGSRFLR